MAGSTEDAAERFRGLDTWKTVEVLSALWNGQLQAVAACLTALGPLGKAVDEAAERLAHPSGRLVYVGAGSSGVIAVLDAIDLGTTFDWPNERLCMVLPGGLDLSQGLADSAEDDGPGGSARMDTLSIGPRDVVVAVSASGRSAFTVGALARSAERGALSIAFTNMAGSPLAMAARHAVAVETGAEVIAGSTRLGAGTSQKVLFNLFSTALMTRLGAVHDNLMVNVRPENIKLRHRCAAMVARIASVDTATAEEALSRHGTVKRAVLGLAGVAEAGIGSRLDAAGGVLRRALTAKEPNR
jgi:N-acetylmuramic acid 6-phosphate etherase